MTIVIGLTGSIAAGKSSIAGEFVKQGAVAIDCDKIVVALYEAELIPIFQQEFPEVMDGGKISKALIKQHIMPHPDKKKLEDIVHPAVRTKVGEFVASNQGKIIVVETQLLFESGIHRRPEYGFNHTVTVTAPYKQRLNRNLTTRPHITEDQFRIFNDSQMPDKDKKKLADFIVLNNDGMAPESQVRDILEEVIAEKSRRKMDSHEKFFSVWRDLASNLHFPAQESEKVLKELYASYGGSKRFYHSVVHIAYFLGMYERYREQIKNPEEFLLAIYFHDFIHDGKRYVEGKTNEEKSAEAADAMLERLGYPREKIERVNQYIRATEKHLDSGDGEINLFLDMDLSILAMNEKIYDEYAENIRKEYSPNMTMKEYASGRKDFLQRFTARPTIFLTPEFQLNYDHLAKGNLARELTKYEEQAKHRGIYAGSFDPITRGHMNIILESVLNMEKVVVGIGYNADKKSGYFTIDERISLFNSSLREAIEEIKNDPDSHINKKEAVRRLEYGLCEVMVEPYQGMTVDFARKHNANRLMRGMRPGTTDTDPEYTLAITNYDLTNTEDRKYPLTTTLYPSTDKDYLFVSSSLTKKVQTEPELLRKYLYPTAANAMMQKLAESKLAPAAVPAAGGRG